MFQVAVAVAFFAGRLVDALRSRPARRERWLATAREAGLTDVSVEVAPLSDRLAGRKGRLQVVIEKGYLGDEWSASLARSGLPSRDGLDAPSARVTVSGLPHPLGFRPEEPRASARASSGEVQIGDPAFDSAVYVQGPPALLFALLDPPTRVQMVQAMSWPIQIVNGCIHAAFAERYAGGGAGDPLPAMLRPLLQLGERLQRPHDLVERLAAHVREEPIDEVRLWNLTTLAREYPEHPATREALRHACGDACDEMRLRAALMLGPEGRPALLAFARYDSADDTCASRALEAVGAALDSDEVHAILARSLRERRLLTARAAMACLGRVGDERALHTLARVLSVEKGDLAEAAALALGESGNPAAAAALVAALGDRFDFVRVAAARALGQVGTVEAVLPLREAESAHPRDAELRRVAREAVVAIQARYGTASPGQLTLAEGDSGRLSLAEGDEGRLSLTKPSRARR